MRLTHFKCKTDFRILFIQKSQLYLSEKWKTQFVRIEWNCAVEKISKLCPLFIVPYAKESQSPSSVNSFHLAWLLWSYKYIYTYPRNNNSTQPTHNIYQFTKNTYLLMYIFHLRWHRLPSYDWIFLTLLSLLNIL